MSEPAAYTVEEHAGRVVDVLTAPDAGVRLMISRAGAEMVSLARRTAGGDWRGFLWRDGNFEKAASGWNNHATVMGYFVHRLKEQRSSYRGHEMIGGTHGFVRHRTFSPPDVKITEGSASITYEVRAGDYAPTAYPYRLGLRLTYSIEKDGAVRVGFEFRNDDTETTHFSFGLHPGFATESLADCEVLLPAGVYRRHLAPGDFLSGEVVEIDHAGGAMPFDKAALPGSYLLELASVPERKFTLVDAGGGRRVEVDCPLAPYLTLWSDGNAFICIEPCWGLPDHSEQRPFEEKLGIQVIAPGETFARDFTIRASAIE